MLRRLLIPLCLFAAGAELHAQARATATQAIDLQAGGGVVSANADTTYDTARFKGGFVYLDIDFAHHLGAEIEVHQLYSPSADQVHERTYEAGLRYHRTYGRLVPYAKALVGRGVFNFPNNQANLAYNLYAGAAGIDYKLKPWLNLRADFEYQHWLNFPPSPISPTLVSIGAAYHFK